MKNISNRITRVATSTPNLNLDNLLDVDATSAVNGQGLFYSNGKWVNQNINFYKSTITATGDITATLQNIYMISDYTITLPTCTTGDIGKRLMVVCSGPGGGTVALTGLPDLFIEGSYYSAINLISTGGTMELIVSAANLYSAISISGRWFTDTIPGKPFTSSMLELLNLKDVTVNFPYTNGEVLTFSGSTWQNLPLPVTSVFGRTGAITAATGDYALSQLSDAVITTPSNGQVLTYNSTSSKWENAAGGGGGSVSSVFGRTGAVVSAEGDYSLTQLSDVTITTPSTGQILGYNGTNWLNQNIYGNFTTISNLTGPISVTGVAGTMYIGGGVTLNMPNGAVGDIIQLAATGGANTIVFPTGVFLIHGAAGYQNFSMASNFGVATLLCTVANTWVLIGLTDLWTNTAITKNFSGSVIKVADLFDSNITTPSNGQVLTYNSGSAKWVNSASAVTSVYGRTGAVTATEGDYSFTQLSDVTLTAPSAGQTMRFDGTNWVNFTNVKSIYFSSAANLISASFIGQNIQSATANNCKIIVSNACTLVGMSVKLTLNPSSTNSRTFQVVVNGSNVASYTVTITGSATTAFYNSTTFSLNQFDDITIVNTLTGTPFAAVGYITLDYYI